MERAREVAGALAEGVELDEPVPFRYSVYQMAMRLGCSPATLMDMEADLFLEFAAYVGGHDSTQAALAERG